MGNRRFRVLCDINEAKYAAATSKTEMTVIVVCILDAVRKESQGFGSFVHLVSVKNANLARFGVRLSLNVVLHDLL